MDTDIIFEGEELPSILAKCSKQLLDELDRQPMELRDAFCLELAPAQESTTQNLKERWRISIRFGTVAWFEKILLARKSLLGESTNIEEEQEDESKKKVGKDKEPEMVDVKEPQTQQPVQDPIQHAIHTARQYIQQQRESQQQPTADPPVSQPKKILPYCPYPATCRQRGSLKCDRGKHAQIMCGFDLERKSGLQCRAIGMWKANFAFPGFLFATIADLWYMHATNPNARS